MRIFKAEDGWIWASILVDGYWMRGWDEGWVRVFEAEDG